MRKSFDWLCGLVQGQLRQNPMSGDLFIFINKRRNRIKLLRWETGGFVLFYKRLEKGTFESPEIQKPALGQKDRLLLKHQLAELKRMIFGAKRERFIATDINQATLFDLPGQPTKPEAEEEITYTRNKGGKNKKQPLRLELAPHLPRREETIEPEGLPEGAKLATCKINNVEPFAWLKHVLDVIPDYPANQLHNLLPGQD